MIKLNWFALLIISAVIAGCGGGESNSSGNSGGSVVVPTDPVPPVTPVQPVTNYIRLDSEAGDYVGQGKSYSYTPETASIEVEGSGNLILVTVNGDKFWQGAFQVMNTLDKVLPDTYSNIATYPSHDPAKGGMGWWGDGRGCNTIAGSFTVSNATYINKTLSSLDLQFEQLCDGSVGVLRGDIHWVGDPATLPIGETPLGSWQPPMGITPEYINFVYLDSDPKEWVGSGWKYGYTQENSLLTVTASGNALNVSVDGNEKWSGRFVVDNNTGVLHTGDTGIMGTISIGTSYWFGEGHGCGRTGWFIIDKATYNGGTLTEIDLRFEQICEYSTRALHGAVHWKSSDTTAPPGPVNPPPENLWKPGDGITPQSGNFAYLESEAGDFVGLGKSYLYTQQNSVLSVKAIGRELTVDIKGDLPWLGNIATINTDTQLQPGYYANVRRYPFHNPVKGGLDWGGDLRGCNQLYGWFAIDSVTYENGILSAIDYRFEQHCEGAAPALRGAIHWNNSDTSLPAGPVNPPPADLWQPPAGSIPASGNYMYFESSPGNYVGQGQTYLYTPSTATITPTVTNGYLYFDVSGSNHWSGYIHAMDFLNHFEAGYYEVNDRNYHNPTKGTLVWSMDSYGCSGPVGWFVIDNVTYVNNTLTSIDYRFKQQCAGEVSPLYGAVHWVF